MYIFTHRQRGSQRHVFCYCFLSMNPMAVLQEFSRVPRVSNVSGLWSFASVGTWFTIFFENKSFPGPFPCLSPFS